MAWAIITMYTFKCAQMDPKQLPKTSTFYSRSKKCDIKKTLGVGTTPLGSPKVNQQHLNQNIHNCFQHSYFDRRCWFRQSWMSIFQETTCTHDSLLQDW